MGRQATESQTFPRGIPSCTRTRQNLRDRAMLHSHPEASIVVLGDAMLDIYINGDVERISPEAPVPIVRRRHDKQVVGGAGNVACNIARLGGASTLITTVGDDLEGAGLVTLLKAEGVSVDAVVTPGRATISKTRVMGGSHHLLRIDREDRPRFRPLSRTPFLPGSRMHCRAPRAAISDYAKGMLTDRVLVTAIALARAQRVPVIVDPKRREFSAYAGADVIKPNPSSCAASDLVLPKRLGAEPARYRSLRPMTAHSVSPDAASRDERNVHPQAESWTGARVIAGGGPEFDAKCNPRRHNGLECLLAQTGGIVPWKSCAEGGGCAGNATCRGGAVLSWARTSRAASEAG